MLTLWQEVSRLELIFHQQLFEILKLYLAHEHVISNYDKETELNTLKRYKNPKLRTLKLEERQAIFKAIQSIYVSLDPETHPATITLKEGFEIVQNCRLRYNSKVLYYNHFIHVFPTKILAKRMNFLDKEYFG